MKMARAGLFILFIGIGTVAFARPSTQSMSCREAQALLASKGAVVMTTGPHTYERFLADDNYCMIAEYADAASAPTKDVRSCPLGFTCKTCSDVTQFEPRQTVGRPPAAQAPSATAQGGHLPGRRSSALRTSPNYPTKRAWRSALPALAAINTASQSSGLVPLTATCTMGQPNASAMICSSSEAVSEVSRGRIAAGPDTRLDSTLAWTLTSAWRIRAACS